MCGIACGAIVAAVAALPTSTEIAYGFIGDKNFVAARQRLINLYEEGSGDLHSAMALHDVHLRFGDVEQADNVMQGALKAYPGHAVLLRRAVRFYAHTQQPAKRLATLVRLLRIEPTSELLDEALQLLRLHSNYEGEKAILAGFANSPMLSAAQHVRLAFFFAREQNYDLAVKHFVRADQMSTKPIWRARMALFRVLLLQDRVSRTRGLVEQWLSGKTGKDQIAFFYHQTIDARRTELAQSILEAAIRRGHVSQDDADQMRRDAQG
ncbi:MAG: tetratricopeptide repeat protein [Hyphomicrobiaceae bacterium]